MIGSQGNQCEEIRTPDFPQISQMITHRSFVRQGCSLVHVFGFVAHTSFVRDDYVCLARRHKVQNIVADDQSTLPTDWSKFSSRVVCGTTKTIRRNHC